MIDDIDDFRSRLRALAMLYVAHLVNVFYYKEWAEEQEWYKMDYFKTHLKDILLYGWYKYTKEVDQLIFASVYDVIFNFASSAKRLSKTMSLFLEFTAKAADVKLLRTLLESVSRLAHTSEVMFRATLSFRVLTYFSTTCLLLDKHTLSPTLRKLVCLK